MTCFFNVVQGCSIQASVPEELIHLFRFKLFTSCVYIISSFKVVQNLGSYRVTNHKYRLVFMVETFVHVVVGSLNRMNDFCFADSSVISRHQNDCDFLAGIQSFTYLFESVIFIVLLPF